MNAREIAEEMAFHVIEPLPDGYWQAAMIAKVMVDLWGSRGHRAKLKDFLPDTGAASSSGPQTLADEKRPWLEFAMAHNANLAAKGSS